MERKAWIVAGLAYGDEGKGATVDFLCRREKADLVVRYNGGCQAGHNVVTPEGQHHTFAQFGAGTFVPEVVTFLSRFVLVDPISMMVEEQHLQTLGIPYTWQRVFVDENAVIVTPFHRAANRVVEKTREQKGTAHGTCGLGIGMARHFQLERPTDTIYAKDLKNSVFLKEKLCNMQRFCRAKARMDGWREKDYTPDGCLLRENDAVDWTIEQYQKWPATLVPSSWLSDALEEHERVVFEGAQGVLLDEDFGQAPHTTWTNTTFSNANCLLAESSFDGKTCRVGVVRSYYTRHGAGPFATEDPNCCYPEPHNNGDGMQGHFRQGRFDPKLFNYAVNVVGGIDVLALNHLDRYKENVYAMNFVTLVKELARTDDLILGFGPTTHHRVVGVGACEEALAS